MSRKADTVWLPLDERLALMARERALTLAYRSRLLTDDRAAGTVLLRALRDGPQTRQDLLRRTNIHTGRRLTAITEQLAAAGLIEIERVPPRSGRGGWTATRYRITPAGRRALRADRR